jgi:hypothetical protein
VRKPSMQARPVDPARHGTSDRAAICEDSCPECGPVRERKRAAARALRAERTAASRELKAQRIAEAEEKWGKAGEKSRIAPSRLGQ